MTAPDCGPLERSSSPARSSPPPSPPSSGHSWAVAAGPPTGPLAQVLARCAEATLLVDQRGIVVYAAAAVEGLLGRAPASVLGAPLRDLSAMPDGVDHALTTAAQGGRASEPALAWRHPAGGTVVLDLVVDGLDGGGVVVTVRDRVATGAIDGLRATVAARGAAGGAASPADGGPLVLFVLDQRGSCTQIGKRWRGLTGQDVSVALGVGWLRAVHDADRAVLRGVAGAAHAARRAWRHQFRLVHTGGDVLWVDAAAEPVVGPDGEFAGYIGAVGVVTSEVLAGGPGALT